MVSLEAFSPPHPFSHRVRTCVRVSKAAVRRNPFCIAHGLSTRARIKSFLSLDPNQVLESHPHTRNRAAYLDRLTGCLSVCARTLPLYTLAAATATATRIALPHQINWVFYILTSQSDLDNCMEQVRAMACRVRLPLCRLPPASPQTPARSLHVHSSRTRCSPCACACDRQLDLPRIFTSSAGGAHATLCQAGCFAE